MLKTVIEQPDKTGGFPKLMRYTGTDKDEEVIVLFIDYRCGTYLTGPTIGRHVQTLVMNCFEPFHGKVTIGGAL
ncbi:hypothetical protein [Mesorhizobium sp. M8A.F.Ca.ET.021.01.1.1]|uniref:hypothetical protein n=1 Tax=Mesorhizobium sp. M8A.F.Ca.ET.021.01.1.1 TaxID=2496757 RepID=UPI000FCB1B80|nr:hypothetical protein [Mesorhizobium sp. M8A.F.Ca.ET.021.01.1.1]RUW57137.1 hypothetical protein EOA36_00710 [Mesorhizobium sp. M8A.F.Ca.ET.021.01.1.1]